MVDRIKIITLVLASAILSSCCTIRETVQVPASVQSVEYKNGMYKLKFRYDNKTYKFKLTEDEYGTLTRHGKRDLLYNRDLTAYIPVEVKVICD